MNNESRTKNSIKNVSVAAISKIIMIILSFVSRTIFIKILGTEYLGVNGLFTNILTILSFAELGIGNAIIFKLYKPIAEKDKEQIKTYVNFYKKAYRIIGIVIFTLGIIIIPFLGTIIKDAPDIKENISGIYVLFIINSTISYFFTYKKSIIQANQKSYILSIVSTIVVVIKDIIQIILLMVTKNYILYLIIEILTTIIDNIVASIIANKLYPYITDKKYNKLSKAEEKNIFDDVKALVAYKLGGILSNGTDNIIISTFIGIKEVGLLSNYHTIVSSITALCSTAFSAFTASVGNLNTIREKEKKEAIYYQIILLSFYIYGYISIALILLINKFITIWLGSQYLLDFAICVALGFDLYVDGMRFSNYTFRNTMGMFKKGKWMPLISSITNVILSIALVKPMGIFGVIIATGITRMIIMTMYDPYLLHKYKFETPALKFYKRYFYYLAIFVIDIIICALITNLIKISGILGFIISGITITAITILVFMVSTIKMEEFNGLKQKLIFIIKKQ